ncbi:MAG: TrkA family potassium uptake protein [Chloroflexota bacterium]|nr:TrkA family potassium uptake protein [Chloroflexota bacterium]MDE2942206.1 TrkA family potassium uptake protein [Chloroflexota bacterium]
MYIVVIGAGKIGYNLSRSLLRSEHEVMLVERSADRYDAVRRELGNMVTAGDGCDEETLMRAGTARADVFIATTGRDQDNLVSCQIAKHRFRATKTIALVNIPANVRLFEALGVDALVSSTDVILRRIEEELPVSSLVHLMSVRSANRQMVGIRIPSDAAVVGRSLGQVSLPADSLISFIVKRNGTLLPPDQDAILASDDEVVAVTTSDSEEILREALTGTM